MYKITKVILATLVSSLIFSTICFAKEDTQIITTENIATCTVTAYVQPEIKILRVKKNINTEEDIISVNQILKNQCENISCIRKK